MPMVMLSTNASPAAISVFTNPSSRYRHVAQNRKGRHSSGANWPLLWKRSTTHTMIAMISALMTAVPMRARRRPFGPSASTSCNSPGSDGATFSSQEVSFEGPALIASPPLAGRCDW